MSLKQKQKEALRLCLEEHKGEEHLLGYWLVMVNNKLCSNRKFSNTKALGRAMMCLLAKGYLIKKRVVKLRSNYSSSSVIFYKYFGKGGD